MFLFYFHQFLFSDLFPFFSFLSFFFLLHFTFTVVGGILHLRLEVIAPPQVKHFPFGVADVTKVIDQQASAVGSSLPFIFLTKA